MVAGTLAVFASDMFLAYSLVDMSFNFKETVVEGHMKYIKNQVKKNERY